MEKMKMFSVLSLKPPFFFLMLFMGFFFKSEENSWQS